MDFQSGGIEASMGFPLENRICNWLGLTEKLLVPCEGHQGKRPKENLFCASQKPLPSNTNIFNELRFLLVKMNIMPLKGSSSKALRQRAASPSMPARKSAGRTANNSL